MDQQRNEPADNYDAGKLRYDLLPPDALEELVRVYTVGAEKYAERNWEKGMAWCRAFGSLMRHAWAWMLTAKAEYITWHMRRLGAYSWLLTTSEV
jgi:hypothetical protein